VDQVQLVRDTWDALSRGDLAPLESVLAPDARWRAVEDGPWNCENSHEIIAVLTENLGGRLSGRIEDAFGVGERVVVAFRPDREPDGWPLDNGIRYVVISVAGDRITEMKGCANREVALSYAGSSPGGEP
jgi:ketosteroid isomerase-like protein